MRNRTSGIWCLLIAICLSIVCSSVNLALGAPSNETPLKEVETSCCTIRSSQDLHGLAKELAKELDSDAHVIYRELGIERQERISITLTHDQEELLATAKSENGGTPPDWAEGLAYPASQRIYLHAGMPISEIKRTLKHELSHVAFGELAKSQVPLWFQEGLAIAQSESLALDRIWLLTQASLTGHPLSFRELTRGFPKGKARAGIAYAQSVHFIGYFRQNYGEPAFRKLIQLLHQGELSFDQALQETTGIKASAIESQWRKSLEHTFGFLYTLFGDTGLFVIAGGLLLAAFIIRSRQRKRKFARMAREESKIDQIMQMNAPIPVEARRRYIFVPRTDENLPPRPSLLNDFTSESTQIKDSSDSSVFKDSEK